MVKNISKVRLLIYFMLLGAIPFLFVLMLFFRNLDSLSELEGQMKLLEEKALTKERRQALNALVQAHYRDADHFYIDKHLETLSLLEPEIESLQKAVEGSQFIEDEAVKNRLDFLTEDNSLVFSEGVVQTYPSFQETVETLVHPVEVRAPDIEKILTIIEGIPIGSFTPPPNRPDLMILEFKLERKSAGEKSESFLLNLKLLKREYM